MTRRALLAVLLVVLLVMVLAELALGAAADDPLAECAALELTEQSACLYRAARDPARRERAAERLAALLDAHPDAPHLAFSLGRLELDRGRIAPAMELFEHAASAFAATEDATYETWARLNLGECLRLVDRLPSARDQLERAVLAARTSGDAELLVHARLSELQLARQQGEDLADLLRRMREIERDIERDGVGYNTSRRVFYELANLLASLFRFDEAYAVNTSWAAAARAAGHAGDEAAARVNLATCVSEMPRRRGARGEALRLARDGLAMAESAGQPFAEFEALRLLGMLLPGEEGRAHLRRCLEQAPAESAARLACLFALAGSISTDDPAAADLALDAALAEADAIESPWPIVHGWGERFRVRWAARPPDAALADSLTLLGRIEDLRDRQISRRGRADFFAAWTEVYYSLLGRLLNGPGEPDRAALETAFRVSERMRARILLDLLTEARIDTQDAALIRRATDFADLATIESTLADDEALLVFHLAPDEDVFSKPAGGSRVLAVTRRGTRVHPLPGAVELEEQIAMLLGLFETDEQELLADVASALRGRLLDPALEALPPGVTHWTLVPDGLLHLVPFHLLAPEKRISTAASATLWLHDRRWTTTPPSAAPSRAAPSSAALVLADPAPQPGSARAADLRAELGPLPHARREGRRVLDHLGGTPSRLLEGEAASESRLKRGELADFAILHFAAHALLDTENPERSALVLAPGAEPEDGLLHPSEIARLPLHETLVVLSACRGAAGRPLLGEGVDSLARAFFEGGARTVVANLWPLRDDDAARFFDLFYRALAKGESVGAAGDTARRARRQEGAAAPAWAGIVVLGDDAMVPFPGGLPRRRTLLGLPWWVWLGVGLGLSLVAGAWRIVRRRW